MHCTLDVAHNQLVLYFVQSLQTTGCYIGIEKIQNGICISLSR
jgi:hypothetical protein